MEEAFIPQAWSPHLTCGGARQAEMPKRTPDPGPPRVLVHHKPSGTWRWLKNLERRALGTAEKGLDFHAKEFGLDSVKDGDEESESQKKVAWVASRPKNM